MVFVFKFIKDIQTNFWITDPFIWLRQNLFNLSDILKKNYLLLVSETVKEHHGY